MRVVTASILFVLAALAVTLAGAADVPSFTEADFKKMKIKQLKTFLDERGLSCDGCEEKDEFVRMAIKNINAPVSKPATKSGVPEGTLWSVLSGVAKELCEQSATNKGVAAESKETICSAITSATENVFMQYGKRTATKLRKKPEALLKTSWGEIYQQAGRKLLTKVAGYCFHAKNAGKCSSSGNVQAMLEVDGKIKGVELLKYLTNVGIENTNTMYEAIKDKALNNEEL
jgi:hypothetical protein